MYDVLLCDIRSWILMIKIKTNLNENLIFIDTQLVYMKI